MKIHIEKAGINQYIGTLDLGDGTVYTSHRHYRPGCVARELLNGLLAQYGQPKMVDLEILEWE